MYYVIHSLDPYLLARFCTELQMETGLQNCHEVNKDIPDFFCPFNDMPYLHIDPQYYSFHNHDYCDDTPESNRLTLTEENYKNVLYKVINQEV
jgi:hypothetical protein